MPEVRLTGCGTGMSSGGPLLAFALAQIIGGPAGEPSAFSEMRKPIFSVE